MLPMVTRSTLQAIINPYSSGTNSGMLCNVSKDNLGGLNWGLAVLYQVERSSALEITTRYPHSMGLRPVDALCMLFNSSAMCLM